MSRTYRYKEIQLAQLRGFCAVAAHENFTAAAEALGVSASTVWEQVRALEKRLGTVLIRHHGRGLEVTREGRLLYQLVEPHVEGLDSLQRLFEEARSQLPQNVTVASTQYLFRYHLSAPIQQFAKKHPGIQVNMQLPDVSVVQQVIEKGEADLAVIPYDLHDTRNPALDFEDLFDLPLVLMTPPDHPVGRKKRVRLQDVLPYPVILPSKGTYMRRLLDRVLDQHGINNLRVAMDIPLFDTTLKAVSLGAGVALVYIALKTASSLTGLTLHPFDPAPEPLPIAMVTRKHAHLPVLVKEFQEVIRKASASAKSRA
jgi:DNA-binding transcriptional LysR family regulator